MKKVLFLIHNLGQGGAEKVLVNLVNNLDKTEYETTVEVLFGGGVNEQFLNPDVKLKRWIPFMIPGNSKIMKLFSPKFLHSLIVREKYDIEVAYLEGPTTRVISGCTNKDTKLVTWLHSCKDSFGDFLPSYRNRNELVEAYNRFNAQVFVSREIKEAFESTIKSHVKKYVLYNTIESDFITRKANEESAQILPSDALNIIAVGSLKQVKGFDRLLRVVCRLKKEGYSVHLTILGRGSLEAELKSFIEKNELTKNVDMLGYDVNPYKYLKHHDVFVCSSYSEGLSTAVTEALILGVPVVTTRVSGMEELLGNSEYGLITENSEEGLYIGLKRIFDSPALLKYFREKAAIRGKEFYKDKTVFEVDKMFQEI